MSKAIFGETGIEFKDENECQDADVFAQVYSLYSNVYGDVIDNGSDLKDFVGEVYSEVGGIQGEMDTTKAGDIEDHDLVDTVEYNSHEIPAAFGPHLEGESDAESTKEAAQQQLRNILGSDGQVIPAGNGSDPESDDSDEDDDPDMSNDSDNPVAEIPGIGNGTVEKVVSFFNTETEAVSEILEQAETVENFETVEVDELAAEVGEEKAEAMRTAFPDKTDEAILTFLRA